MTKRVLYSQQTQRVLEWQDTEHMNYAEPGRDMAVVNVSESDWLRQDTLSWYHDGALTDVEPVITYPPPTPEAIHFRNTADRNRLMAEANTAITPLQYAVDLGIESEREAELLDLWKRYVVEVNRIDLTLLAPDWPEQPEEPQARPVRAFS